jgi:membrane fusion protein (multidrug efflux system)
MGNRFGTPWSISDPVRIPSPVELAALRKRLLSIIGVVVAVVAIAFALQRLLWGPPAVSTEDAYVNAVLARVTPQIEGVVSAVYVHDTQTVHRGQLLAEIDNRDAWLEVDAAKAQYDKAYREVMEIVASVNAAKQNVLAKQLQVDRAKTNYERRANIGVKGAVAEEEIYDAKSVYSNAVYELEIARQQLEQRKTAVDKSDLLQSPGIRMALAVLNKAKLHLERTKISAPIDGVVAQSRLAVGQQVASGVSVMSIVPTHNLYVDANFKENQLSEIRPGQSVTLRSDVYGSRVVYHGVVEGVAGGTGSVFSIIPAQNASGNWIKVVQRLPIRIAIDQADLKANPLWVGVSMDVTIDTSAKSGYSSEPRPSLRLMTY